MAKKEGTSELREEMLKTLGVSDNMSPEYDRVINWIDNLMDGLRNVMAKAMDEWPEGEDAPLASLFVGLAQFNCRVLEQFQRKGYVKEGHNVYDLFMTEIMPTCHEMVVRSMDKKEKESIHEEMANELADPDIPIEVIVKEFFRDDMPDKERQEVIKTMTDIRREYISLKTKK